MRLPAFVCLLARLLENACMDLKKFCVSTNVGTWTNLLTFQPDPHYSPDAGTTLLSPISYKRCNMEFYYVGKIPRICTGCPSWLTFEPDPHHNPDAGTGVLSRISYTLQKFAALPSLAYFSANLAYFSAISVSICAKLAHSILMMDRNTTT